MIRLILEILKDMNALLYEAVLPLNGWRTETLQRIDSNIEKLEAEMED